MSGHADFDEFDAAVRRALSDVVVATRPDPSMADRLIVGAASGRRSFVRLDDRRGAGNRWLLPLIAAIAVVLVAVVAAVAAHDLSRSHHSPPVQRHTIIPAPVVVPGFHPTSLEFTDPDHGWALGDAKCPTSRATDCATLIATSDAGSTWRLVPIPAGLVSTFDESSCGSNGAVLGPCVDNVAFANASTGYLWSTHELYVTTNGGRTWTRNPHGATAWGGASQLIVTDRTVVRLFTIVECSSGCPTAVQWAPLGTLDFHTVQPGKESIGLLSSALQARGNNVYLFAGSDSASSVEGLGILVSTDGGRTYRQSASDPCGQADVGFYYQGEVVADDGSLLVGCTDGIQVRPSGSPRFAALPPYFAGHTVTVVSATSATDLTVNDQSGVPTQNNQPLGTRFCRTRDAGRTWQCATLGVGNLVTAFTSGTVGYAISPTGVLYTTHDGGLTWTTGALNR